MNARILERVNVNRASLIRFEEKISLSPIVTY